MSYPAFRPSGLYYCFFGNEPYGHADPDYDPIVGYAPMGRVSGVAMMEGTYVSPTQLTCLSPSWNYPRDVFPAEPVNGPVDVVIVDQNPTGLSLIELAPGEFRTLNVVFYQAAAWSWLQPTILSIAPTSGPGNGSDPFTITGINFYPGHIGAGGESNPNYIAFGTLQVPVVYVNATTLTGVTPSFFSCDSALVDVTLLPPRLNSWYGNVGQPTIAQPSTTLPDAYTFGDVWWQYVSSGDVWSYETCDLLLSTEIGAWITFRLLRRRPPFDFEWKGVRRPGTDWVPAAAPDPNGWWTSVSGYRGDIFIVAGARPEDPRTWTDFAGFATGTAAMLGGSPGIATTYRNRLIYAASGYTVGTDAPPIRLYDGSYDRELVTLPPTATGPAKAVVSLLTANGTVYVSTWDAGTDSSTWTGRVFALDLERATLLPLGAAFPAGHLPYALAWHNGMLWCGTHRGATPAAGKIYSLRPELQEEAVWTEEHDLGTVYGAAALCSFHGTLYVGTTGDTGVFGTIIARASDGTWTTADTGTGGTAKPNNGFLALTTFQDVLYASYWNGDTTAIARIRKSVDGVTWTTSYTGAAGTLRPFIVLKVDDNTLFAVGGGLGLTAAVVSTADGVTWTDLTAELPESDKTALPAVGVVVM